MQYKGIIFDFNGTLFWDSAKHLEAWREFSKRVRPYPFTDDEMRKYMFGRTNEDILAYLLGKRPAKDLVIRLGKEKEAVYRQMCREDSVNTHLAPFAEKFLDYLKGNNIPMTIATMSDKDNVDFYIEEFNLKKWFDIDKIVYDNGKIKGKPAPDIYLKAAANLNLAPEDCVVIEDALSGIDAAHNAKIGKIIAIASLEPVSYYENIPAVSEVITDFSDFEKIMSRKPLTV